MVAQYIATRSFLDLCELAVRKKEAWMGMRWWEQAGIELTEERFTAAVEVDEDGMEE